MDINFSVILQQYLKLNNKTQKQLADDLHVSSSTISGYCLGTRLPDLNMLKKIQKKLNIPIELLFDNDIDKTLSSLDDNEMFLITSYKKLSNDKKESFMKLAKDILEVLD